MPPPCPTSTRICSAKAPTPARASTTSTPSRPRSPAACRTRRCSATICSRACSPAPASPPTSRSSRSFPPATTSPPASPSLGARRLAAAAVDPRARTDGVCGSDAQRDPGDRPLEDARQSAADALGAGRRPRLAGRLDAAVQRRARLDRASCSRRSCCRPCSRCIGAIVPRRAGIDARQPSARPRRRLRLALTQSALQVAFLAHQAWLMGDAIGRTLYPAVRHPPASARMGDGGAGDDRPPARSRSASIAGWPARSSSASWRWSSPGSPGMGRGRWRLPFAALWIASPAIARWVSLSPLVAGRLPVSDADARALRLIARRTWRFFETFVTPADHMLPPDNFQEDPPPALAHRTSPTNLGLYLLSTVDRPRLRLDRERSRRSSGWRRRSRP